MGWTGIYCPERPDTDQLNRIVDNQLRSDRFHIADRSGWLDHNRHQFVLMEENTDPHLPFVIVVLAEYRDHHIMIKEVEESMGPLELDCPLRIMKKLEGHRPLNDYSSEWRAKVLKHHEDTAPRKAVLRKLRQEYPNGENRLVLTDGRTATYHQGRYRGRNNTSAYTAPGTTTLNLLRPDAIDADATRTLWADTSP